MHESLPVRVTLIVEVDGHRLSFEQTGKATGARYHGAEPQHGYTLDDALEYNIRGSVAAHTNQAVRRAVAFLQRAYPIHTDREDTK